MPSTNSHQLRRPSYNRRSSPVLYRIGRETGSVPKMYDTGGNPQFRGSPNAKSVEFVGYFFVHSHFPPLFLPSTLSSPTSPFSHFSPSLPFPKEMNKNSVIKIHESNNDIDHIVTKMEYQANHSNQQSSSNSIRIKGVGAPYIISFAIRPLIILYQRLCWRQEKHSKPYYRVCYKT